MNWFFHRRDHQAKRYRTVDQLYADFQHVICVSNKHYYDLRITHDWAMENGCVLLLDRAIYDPWMNRWFSNGIGGEDLLFLATDDPKTATIAIMRWT